MYLNDNRLTGTIPSWLGDLRNLSHLYLANNQLSGCIPASLRGVSSSDLDSLGMTYCGDNTPTPTPTPTPGGIDAPTATPTPTATNTRAASTADRAALVALYEATDGANWTNSNNWLSEEPLGSWYGVTTDDSGRVTQLSLSSNGMSGSISNLSSLTRLNSLILFSNRLTGRIPTSLGSL